MSNISNYFYFCILTNFLHQVEFTGVVKEGKYQTYTTLSEQIALLLTWWVSTWRAHHKQVCLILLRQVVVFTNCFCFWVTKSCGIYLIILENKEPPAIYINSLCDAINSTAVMIRFGVETHFLTLAGYATMPAFVEVSKKKKMMEIRA